MKMKGRACELCNQEASLYCPSDSAFLCSNCDAAVHEANFLVARHLRYFLCSQCNRFSAAAVAARPTCLSCSPEIPSDSLPSSSSSAAESCATDTASEKINLNNTTEKKRTRKCSSSVTDDASSTIEQGGSMKVFVKWSGELGLDAKNGNRVAALASHALGFCLGKWRALPFRVAAATSFWFGLRFCGFHNQNQNLTRLEAISGVPAKLILAAHAKLARVFTHRREFHSSQQQEGWDES